MTGAVWQLAAIEQLRRVLEPEPAVKALILVGSTVTETVDPYSDVDLICVVDDASITQFYPTTDWLHLLGEIFALEQSQQADTFVSRVCLTDFHCLDLVFILENAIQKPGMWRYPPGETRILFSRSTVVDSAIAAFSPVEFSPLTADQFERMTAQFWFKSIKAVNKIMRNDHLIGLHLALDLARDCLVLGMIFRDGELETTVHRHGGLYNEVATQLQLQTYQPTAHGILDLIDHCTQQYDELAYRWSSAYRQRHKPFNKWLRQMQAKLV